jgi:broad specificity phosphatase PhoE
VPALFLIRHAQASYGAVDYDVLSDTGYRQATVLDRALMAKGVKPAIVVSGPARRHRDTARRCEQTMAGIALAEDERWAEFDTDRVLARHSETAVQLNTLPGAAQLSSRDFQVVLDAALEEWVRDRAEASSGAGWLGYMQQVSEALNDLGGELERGQIALVFTSAGAIAAACCWVLGLPATAFVALNRVQINTGITKLAIGRRGTSLVSFNEHGHLEEADRFLVTSR